MKDRLRAVRLSTGLNQEQFGEEISVGRQSVAFYESGRRQPSNKTINLICATFGISKKWLLTGEGDMKEPTGDAKEIADIAKSVMTHTDDRFRLRLVKAITEMSDEELRAFKAFVVKVTSEDDSRIAPSK